MKIKTDWESYQKYNCKSEVTGFYLDYSRMGFEESLLLDTQGEMKGIYAQLAELESGAIANPDENRMVGHYWLRAPHLAPKETITNEIEETIADIIVFAKQVHDGTVRGERENPFKNFILIGIGGSSLGSKFISDALGKVNDPLKAYFIDNTDPDGMDRIFASLEDQLSETMVLVVSKSGSTIETANGMLETMNRYAAANLDFTRHAVAITGEGSKLHLKAESEDWLAIFPMWDWVGGRTSVCSAVGLLPMALQGIDIQSFLQGAKDCDEETRKTTTTENPAALMALMWRYFTKGQGGSQMVVLPYKDRLELFSKYLQQLVMESLGKEKDLSGETVHQGIAVYGNKGSSDQHSFVQQLLDGPDNFFVTFIEVLRDREGESPDLGDAFSGDYLQAFLYGTREALAKRGRASLTITMPEVDAYHLGALIALFERAVTFYAFLININAYHQPAVELGKKSAAQIIDLKNSIFHLLHNSHGQPLTIDDIAEKLDIHGYEPMIYVLLRHLCANEQNGLKKKGEDRFTAQYLYNSL